MGERSQPLVAMYVDATYADEYGHSSFEDFVGYAELMGYEVDARAYASALRESRSDPRRLEKSVAAIEALRRRVGSDMSLIVRWHFGLGGWGVLPPFGHATLLVDHLAREGKVVREVARAGDYFLIVTGGADPWSLRRHYVGLLGKEDASELDRALKEALSVKSSDDDLYMDTRYEMKVRQIMRRAGGFFGEGESVD